MRKLRGESWDESVGEVGAVEGKVEGLEGGIGGQWVSAGKGRRG